MNELEIPKIIAIKFFKEQRWNKKKTPENFFSSHLSFFSVLCNIFPFYDEKDTHMYKLTREEVISVGIGMKSETTGGEAVTQGAQQRNVLG